MGELEYRKATLDLSACSRYELSIQVSLDGFLFSVCTPGPGDILWWKSVPGEHIGYGQLLRSVKEHLPAELRSAPSFGGVSVALADPRFSLIPQPLFSDKVATQLLGPSQPSMADTETVITPLHQFDAVLAFPFPEELALFFRQHFPGCLITHEMALLLRNFSHFLPGGLYVHLHRSWFTLISFREGKPDVVNTFEYRTEYDLLYYILSFLNLPGNRDLTVTLSGGLHQEESPFLLLKKHVPRVTLIGTSCPEQAGGFPPEIPLQWLPGLMPLQPCV